MKVIRKVLCGIALLVSIAMFVAVIVIHKNTFGAAFDGTTVWRGMLTIGELIFEPLVLFILSVVGLTAPTR